MPSELIPACILSSLLDSAIKRIYGYVDQRIDGVRAFPAVVIGQSSGMVQIKRLTDPGSGETVLNARVRGFDLANDDRVLVVQVPDWPVSGARSAYVVVGLLQRATPTGHFTLPVGLQIGGSSGSHLYSGSGSPETVVSAPIGSLYLRTDTNAPDGGNQLFVKVSGSGNTGWLPSAKAPRRRMRRDINTYEGASLATSFVVAGFQNGPTITASSTANADATSGSYLQHNTSSSSSNVASVVAGTNSGVRMDWQPDLSMGIRTPATITSIRQWYGLFDGAPSASDDPAVNGFGFRFSTNASDTNWQAWSNDGASTGTVTDTGVAYNANTGHDLRCIVNSAFTAIDFYIDGAWVARHTTNIPASTVVMSYGLYVTTLTAAARALRWGRITLENEP